MNVKKYTNEGPPSALQRQSDADGFFLLLQCGTPQHHRAKQSPKSTTGMYSVTYVMLCGARDRSCGQQEIGASINAPALYSLDMASCDFWMDSKLKRRVRGISDKDIIIATTDEMTDEIRFGEAWLISNEPFPQFRQIILPDSAIIIV
ncbi:hypothetical protein LAZ67_11000855 [Cordylochernes scorpioides]|uniref:Uncharacterized protein n=1 Tax=Cordylochernes scorpioides TaxID=51811 RepID=A0ABY6KY23_9ARAC|nr:hypothetical protein LAZ67_11000855 [Cordylochernes scorpioides]